MTKFADARRRLLVLLTVSMLATVLPVSPVSAQVLPPVVGQVNPPILAKVLLVAEAELTVDANGVAIGGQAPDRQAFDFLSPSYDVVSVADNALDESDLVGVDVVVLTASTSSSNFRPFMLKATVPVVTLKASSTSALGLAPLDAGNATPLQSISDVSVTAVSHPVTTGFSGDVSLFVGGATKSVARGWTTATLPAAGSGPILLANGTEGAALFAYEPGAALGLAFPDPDDVAQDCRVVFPAHKTTELSAAGLSLFGSAVAWSVSSACGLQPLPGDPVAHPTPATPSLDQNMCFVDPANETERMENGVIVPIGTGDPNLSSLWVRALEHDAASDHLFIGGRFETAFDASDRTNDVLSGGVGREGVFSCDLATGTVTPFEVPIEINPFAPATPTSDAVSSERVRALAIDGQWVYVGGKFALDPGETPPATFPVRNAYNLIRVDKTTGAIDYSWAPDVRGGVSALEVGADGFLYVAGGVHTTIDAGVASTAARLVRVSISTGDVDPNFRPMITPGVADASGTYFASVFALEISNNVLYAAGSFEYVNAAPTAADWAAYDTTVGANPATPLPAANQGTRRNSVAAFALGANPTLTGFAPSIGDNNIGADETAQIKDVVADGNGSVFLCGDWWVTNATPNLTWTAYDHDGGGNNTNGTGWEGEFSKTQPRPNQHNFGKFDAITGASAIGPDGLWGATTDGGVQGCDYDAQTDTLIIGGHYESIGRYEDGFVPANDDDYPGSHRSLEKVNAIDGATGRFLEWDPDLDSVRGLDAVRVIPGATEDETLIAVGGSFTVSDRMNREGLSLYSTRLPRETVLGPWELHQVDIGGGTIADPITAGTVATVAATPAQKAAWTPGPDPADHAGQPGGGGGGAAALRAVEPDADDPELQEADAVAADEAPQALAARALQDEPLGLDGGVIYDSTGTPLPELKAVDTDAEWEPAAPAGDIVTVESGELETTDVLEQALPRDLAREVSPVGAAVVVAQRATGNHLFDDVEEELVVDLDVSSLGIDPNSDISDRLTLVYLEGCAVVGSKNNPSIDCLSEIALDSEVDVVEGRARGTKKKQEQATGPNGVARDAAPAKAIGPSITSASSIARPSWPFAADGSVRYGTDPSRLAIESSRKESVTQAQGFGLIEEADAVGAGQANEGGFAMFALAAGNSGSSGDYGATPQAPNATYQVGQFAGSVDLGYPISVPAAAGGASPQVGLSYSSGGVDSFVSGRNNQAGPVGIGWSLGAGGSIRRSTIPCPGNPHMCFDSDEEYTISFNGYSSKLVLEGTLTYKGFANSKVFRLQQDPIWRVVQITTDPNGNPFDDDSMYWEVQTPDGTRHRFGHGSFNSDDLNSAQWAPMYLGCNGTSPCDRTYQWNLDKVVDLNGNTTIYSYENELDYYADTTGRLPFVRNAKLLDITYGINTSTGANHAQANARVHFNWEARCGSYAAGGVGDNCDWEATDGFLDTPADLQCEATGPCTQDAPSFWSGSRLGSIQTQVWNATTSQWATMSTHDLLNDMVTPPQDVNGGGQAPAKMALRGVQLRPGGGYFNYGFSQLNAVTDGSGFDPVTAVNPTADLGGGEKVRIPNGNSIWFDRTWLGNNAATDGKATAVAIRYSANATATVDIKLNNSTVGTATLAATGGLEEFDTAIIDLSEVGDTKNVAITVTSGLIDVNWIRFHADSYTAIEGQPPVRYDQIGTGAALADHFTASGQPSDTAVLSDGFVFLNNRVYEAEADNSLRLPRVGQMINETGGRVSFTYGQTTTCESIPFNSFPNNSWETNERDCFPAVYEGAFVVFNKWKVMSVEADSIDNNGAAVTSNQYNATDYEYSGIEWARSDGPGEGPWADFRGHNKVVATERQPDGSSKSKTESYFFQGMNGHETATSVAGGVNNVDRGVDEPWLRGNMIESRVFDKDNQWRQRTIYSTTGRPQKTIVTAGTSTDPEAARWTGPWRVDTISRDPNLSPATGWATVTSRQEFNYDNYGRTTLVRDFGQTTPANSVDDRSTKTQYQFNGNLWLLSLPCRTEQFAGNNANGTQLARTDVTYNNETVVCGTAAADIPSIGNPTATKSFYWSTASVTNNATYDALGRVIETKDPTNSTTTSTYHSLFPVATQVRNALNWGSDTQLDDLGRRATVTGPNGETTNVAYDDYNRVIDVTDYAERNGSPNETVEYEYSTTARPAWVKSSTLFDDSGSGSYLDSTTYYDGFGRVAQESTAAEQTGAMYVVDYGYDSRGQITTQTSRFKTTAGAGSLTNNFVNVPGNANTLTLQVPSYQTFVYDEVGRVTDQATKSYGATLLSSSNDYSLLATRSTDANGTVGGTWAGSANTVTSTSDIRGNLLSVTDRAGTDGAAATTSYVYDDLNRLKSVTDSAGNVTAIGYDWLSRKTWLDDPDTGLWRYTYDTRSNLRSQRRDTAAATTADPFYELYDYDKLNRLTRVRDRNDAKTGWLNSEGFSYDKATNGSGRYGEQRYSQSYTEDRGRVQTYTLGWDEFGMPTNLRVRVIDSANSQIARFNTTIDYGAAGQMVSQRLPGGKGGQLGETISYNYNSRTGRPTAATVNEGVGQIASNIELNEFGQLLSMDNLSGIERGYTYEQGTGRLLEVQAGTDTANVLNLSYSYDPNGNVTTLTDTTNAGQQTCYGYDHVQRLTSAATSGFGTCGTAGQTLGAGGFEHAYSYDAISNITSYGTADRSYTYDPNRPNAVESIANPQDPAQGNWTYDYDDGGNVTERQVEGWDQTFSYDQQQRVTQIDDVAINGVGNTATTNFAYTAGDSRVMRDTDGAQTFYAFGVYEYEIDKATDARTERSTYAVAGERVAVRNQVSNPASDELTWTFTDNLGSASAFQNETTGETGAQRYYPFGHQRVASASDINPTDNGYTGQIRDTATGIYFYNARYYDQHTGRFLAADTIIPNPANPADYNRYTYVRNNPINYNDPTGHCNVGHCLVGDGGDGERVTGPAKTVHDGGGLKPRESPSGTRQVGEPRYCNPECEINAGTVVLPTEIPKRVGAALLGFLLLDTFSKIGTNLDTQNDPEARVTLFHYTDTAGYYEILSLSTLYPSVDGTSGPGVYVTSIDPADIKDNSARTELSGALFRINGRGALDDPLPKTEYVFGISVPLKDVSPVNEDIWKFNRPGAVTVYPNTPENIEAGLVTRVEIGVWSLDGSGYNLTLWE